MAPFDNPYSSNLTNKVSPLLGGQLPDFIQSDHAVFARFLKHYYQYLEAGELRVTVSIDNLLLELETESFALDVDSNKIVLENGTDATTGKFVVGETITGATSKATATILVDDLGHSTKPRLFISGQQQFQTGETITGGTSSATGTVVRYRANPVQNIQQLLEYANVDNTIYDFLDQLRESFMNAIPNELATGVDKRNLIKNIRELYRAKGTSEGHKIFIRMLLDENIDVTYPNKFMMRASDGKWTNQTILRCSPGTNAVAPEMLGVIVTGQSSGATAVIANAISTAESGDPIVIFEINPASLVGTFTDGETIQGTSTVQDVTMSFTVRGIVTGFTVTDGGKLYSAGDDLTLDTQSSIGNGLATAEVGSIKIGSVSRVIVDDAGTKYRVGDVLTFTPTESGTSTKTASGFVSVVDGSLAIDGTDSSSTNAGDNLILEAGSTSSIIEFDLALEDDTGNIILDRIDSGGTEAGENIKTDYGQISLDAYGTTNDTFALEEGTVNTGEITRVFLKDGGEGYSLLPSITITSTNGTGAALLADTTDIGVVDSVNITNQGFKYSEAPEGQFRANFLLKDVTGTFATTNTFSTSGHTGVVKDWNSTTKLLKATFEDVQRTTMETGDSENIQLEDNLFVLGDRAGETDLKFDNIMESGGNTILEDSSSGPGKLILNGTAEVGIDQFVLDGTDSSSTNADSFIIAEGSNPNDSYVDGTGMRFITEAMGDANVSHAANATAITKLLIHNITLEDSPISGEDSVIISEDIAPILLETSPQVNTSGFDDHYPLLQIGNRNRAQFEIVENENESLSINNSITLGSLGDMRVLLDGTDASGTDAGDNIVGENTGNSIVLNGTDGSSSHATDKLMGDVEALSGNIAIDGTNSSSAHAGDNIVNEDLLDFSAETITITDSGGATGTIVSVDIAKGTSSIGTKAETTPSYGVSIENLVGEDLNRIQDSVYYQQFSYEIAAASSKADYLTELKKAVHPAGFNVFGKVSIASQVSMALPTVGSSLGGGYTADTDTYSPILASTFKLIFSEKVQRRTGVMKYDVANFEDEILLEDDNFTEVGTAISMQNEVGGDDTIVLEEYHNPVRFTDRILLNTEYAGEHNAPPGEIILEDSRIENIVILETGYNLLRETDSGDTKLYFLLEENLQAHLTNPYADGRLVAESGVEVTYDLLLEDEELQSGGRLMPGFSGTASYFLIDGLDSSLTGAGDRIVIENAPTSKLLAEPLNDHNVLLNEDGGNQYLETSGKGDTSNKEITLVSMVTTKIMLPRKQASSLPSGLITMAQQPFGSESALIGLEMGVVGGSGSGNLIFTGWNQINISGGVDRVTSAGEGIIYEDAVDDNIGTGFSFEDFGSYSQDIIVLDGTDGSSSNAGDNILINNIGDPDNSPRYLVLNTAADELGNILTAGGELLRVEDELERLNLAGILLGEHSFNYGYMSLEEIIRPNRFLADLDSGNFIMEDYDSDGQGGFIQEDGTLNSPSYPSNYFLLEDYNDNTTPGKNNKLVLEIQYLIPEDEVQKDSAHGFVDKGHIPSINYTDSTVEPYSYSSDTITRPIGVLSLEEETRETTNVQLESGTEGGIFSNLVNDATGTDADGGLIAENSTISLEDYHDVRNLIHGGNSFLLDRTATSGDFTNVGEDIILETATYYDNVINTDKFAVPLTFENAFDSTAKTFDSSLLTWDSTL